MEAFGSSSWLKARSLLKAPDRTMASLFRFRTIVCVTLLVLPACVARLADRNSPEKNGGVTGPAADCSKVQVPPAGAPGRRGRAEARRAFRVSGGVAHRADVRLVRELHYRAVPGHEQADGQAAAHRTGPAGPDVHVRRATSFRRATRQITVKKDAAASRRSSPKRTTTSSASRRTSRTKSRFTRTPRPRRARSCSRDSSSTAARSSPDAACAADGVHRRLDHLRLRQRGEERDVPFRGEGPRGEGRPGQPDQGH